VRAAHRRRRGPRAARLGYILAVAILGFSGAANVAAEPAANDPPAFFDPLAATAPGITREVGLLFDHTRSPDARLTMPSLWLQLPVSSWLQFSIEMPVVLLEPSEGSATVGAGDLRLAGQAMVWTPRAWPVEVDLGLELTLPSGSSNVLAGSTALRPFAAAGVKLGPLDVIGNLSYQWGLDGPLADSELFQVAVAGGYRVRWIAPFAELTLLKAVRGLEDPRPQVSVLPGVEFFLPWNLSLSVGVQLPLGPARFFDQRVLGFLKWQF
jgi:hypothetical protein